MIGFLLGFGSALLVMAVLFAGLVWWVARDNRVDDLVGPHRYEGSE